MLYQGESRKKASFPSSIIPLSKPGLATRVMESTLADPKIPEWQLSKFDPRRFDTTTRLELALVPPSTWSQALLLDRRLRPERSERSLRLSSANSELKRDLWDDGWNDGTLTHKQLM